MTRILTIFLASIIFILVIELVREEKLTFKYAAGWILVSMLAIVLTVFDQVLFDIAHLFGFQLTSNFIFFALLTVFIFLSLLFTVFLCQQNNRNDKVAQRIGLLEFELTQLKKKLDDTSKQKK